MSRIFSESELQVMRNRRAAFRQAVRNWLAAEDAAKGELDLQAVRNPGAAITQFHRAVAAADAQLARDTVYAQTAADRQKGGK